MHKIIFMLNICRSRAEVESEHVSPEMKVNKATTRSGNWRTIMKACDWSKFRGNSLKLWRDKNPRQITTNIAAIANHHHKTTDHQPGSCVTLLRASNSKPKAFPIFSHRHNHELHNTKVKKK
jgi:hypothetical protein